MKVSKLMLCGACVFALAACSIDEVTQVRDTDDDGTISFKAVLPYATRATATTTNNLTEFSVWAWHGDNEFMDDVIAKKNGSVFTTSTLYFWPVAGTVDFYALTPATEITAIETDANGVQTEYAYLGGEFDTEFTDEDGTKWAYKGNVAKAKIAKDAISIEAVLPGSYDEQIDLCYAVEKGCCGGSVPMNFRHALSQVVFKARNTNEEMTIRIGGVSVCSVYKQGTYYVPIVSTTTNLPTDDLGTDGISSTQGYWDANEYHKARFAAGISKTTLEGEVNESVSVMADGGALMLLPQTVDAWDVLSDAHDESLGSYIRIACNISEHGSQLWPNALEEAQSTNLYVDPDDGLEYAEIAIPVDIEWEQGYRYTYNLIFGEGAGYYPPDDPNYDLDGTPILYPVTFSVTVDEFQDTEGVDVSTDTDDIIPYLLDDNFKAYALENYDLNGNGKVSSSEAALVKRIICHTVADFTGIEYFPNLERFTSYSAETLDLSGNTHLMYISLSNVCDGGDAAPIRTLDLSNNLKLESLTKYGFYGCENLETVILPESLTEIESYAFNKCTALKDIKLSDDMTVINFNVFSRCTSLESITLPAALTEIGGFAFAYCSSLSSVDVPEGLTTIGGSAFNSCTSLTEFDFIEGLETMGENAFYGSGLVSVVLPSSLTSIGAACFLSCTSLETIDFSKTGLTSLPFYTCMGCTSLTSVSFPEKLTELSYNVFYQCTSLANIELPKTLKTMGEYAFYDCTVLANVTIPENVESIGDKAFQGCNNMGAVYALPATPPKIGDKTFYGPNINGRRCYLYVHAASVEAYTEAWGDSFASVSAIEN